MPAIQEISETLIREQIVRAVVDVFKTMLSLPIALSGDEAVKLTWPPLSPVPLEATPHVVGTVGFLGDIDGLAYVYFDEPFAVSCTGKMLGMTPAELKEAGPDAVNDAVGELTNMIVGVFKNGLCDAGFQCKLTIPSILRGTNFHVEPRKPAIRRTFWFESCGHRVVADVLFKNED